MDLKRTLTTAGLLGVFATSVLAPTASFADSRQSNKNLWRNLAIGSGVAAGYGLLHHDTTTTVLGAAGAAYSANRYEQDRHSQDEAKRARLRYAYERQRYHRLRYHRTTSTWRRYASSRYASSRGGAVKGYYYTYRGHHYFESAATGLRRRVG